MAIAGIPLDFVLFGLTLLGVALWHHHTLKVALAGLALITLYKLALGDFSGTPGLGGLLQLLAHEWVTLANLLGLCWVSPCCPTTSKKAAFRRCCRATCPTTGRAAS